VLLWILLRQNHKISKRAIRRLEARDSQLFVSVVSIWEIMLRRHAGKLWTEEDPDTIVNIVRSQRLWQILPLEIADIQSLNQIARFTDRTDPFDRILIAQARREKLHLITADRQFSRYGIDVVW
jgi:PIN domain nuclease of toxin-antitoxin system